MSDDQFTTLLASMQTLDHKLDARLDGVHAEMNRRFDEQDETMLKLYRHVERRFDSVDKKFDLKYAELKADIHRIYALLDQDLGQREVDEQERLAMGRQLDRHEQWIQRAARELNSGPSYER